MYNIKILLFWVIFMKTIGIIAEFNPFHKGHEYFINEAKRLSGADSVIIIMSGNYVQRGEPAVWDKFTRAKHALLGGADLVLELPCVYATGSARDFAYGAVSVLNKLNIIDELWFGSEAGDTAVFDMLSDVLSNEPEGYSEALKNGLRSGFSFPKARCEALISYVFSKERQPSVTEDFLRSFLNSPNNILGLEYCIALKKLNSRIVPKTLTRLGAGYNDKELNPLYSSASAIRKAFESSEHSAALKSLPDFISSAEDIDKLCLKTICADDFSMILKYKIMCETAASLASFYDVGDDLARRIKQCENDFKSFTQFAAILKTKNMTYSHICRSLLHIVLNLTPDDILKANCAEFVRVLGINKSSVSLTGEIKKRSAVSLCAKPADLRTGSYDKETFVSNLYESVYSDKFKTDFIHEYQKQLAFKN